jgi:hypothetical protein
MTGGKEFFQAFLKRKEKILYFRRSNSYHLVNNIVSHKLIDSIYSNINITSR